MGAGLNERIETNVERGASALFAVAVGYAAFAWLGVHILQPQLAVYAGGAGAFAYLLCSRALAALARRDAQFRLALFEPGALDRFEEIDELLLTERVEPAELLLTERYQAGELLLTECYDPDELLLTESDRLHPVAAEDGPLILDDILAEIGPDSRVVRLFDRGSMPTPGQLKARIDGHLEQAPATTAPPDASQALSNALAELRRSLR